MSIKSIGNITERYVTFKTMKDVQNFVAEVEQTKLDIEVSSGVKTSDATSILGIASLDITKPLKMKIHASESNKVVCNFLDSIKEYLTEARVLDINNDGKPAIRGKLEENSNVTQRVIEINVKTIDDLQKFSELTKKVKESGLEVYVVENTKKAEVRKIKSLASIVDFSKPFRIEIKAPESDSRVQKLLKDIDSFIVKPLDLTQRIGS